ncbi:MAG: glucosamine inositolphosphorylceramide transferase family protein, partial [Rhodospirillales bacterium]
AVGYLRRQGLRRFLARLGWSLLCRIDSLLLHRSKRWKSHFDQATLGALKGQRLDVTPTVSKSGFVYRYGDDDLAAIRALGLDVLVRCGSGILKGGILVVCRFGVLSFHHADNRVNRGGPPGFWEVFNRDPATGFVIQRLSEELDGGDVLLAGSIPTAFYFSLNQARVFRKSNAFLHGLLDRMGREGRLPDARPKQPYAYPLYRMPGLVDQARYLFGRLLPRAVKKVWHKTVSRRQLCWNVGYLPVGDWREASLRKVRPIPNPPGHFLADPFLWWADGKAYCFVEDYDFAVGRGHLSVYRLDDEGPKPLGPVLKEPFHLSFPFLFQWQGDLLMCPECYESGEIRLYRCEQFPDRWVHFKTLMAGVAAADTQLFEKDGLWWMLTNIDSGDIKDRNSELHVFFADSPVSDHWTAHPGNPVVFDALQARNGGLIIEGSRIFRVFQVQGFDTYGEAMGVAEITHLSETGYTEKVLCTLPPKFLPGLLGTHSMAFRDGLLAVDFLRREKP